MKSMGLMMADDPVAVLDQVPNNRHVHRQDDGHANLRQMSVGFRTRGSAMDQLKYLDGHKKRRFTDHQPHDPANPESQANRLEKHEQAVDNGADGHPPEIGG